MGRLKWVVVLGVVVTALAQYDPGVFASQRVLFFARTDPNGKRTQAGGYTTTGAWTNTLASVYDSALVWNGYKNQAQNMLISFTASSSVTTSGYSINFNPSGNCEVVYIVFSIIALISNPAAIELQSYQFVPSAFRNAPHAADEAGFFTSTKFIFKSSESYHVSVFISDFECTGVYSGYYQDLKVYFSAITYNTNQFVVALYSEAVSGVTFNYVRVTSIIVNRTAFVTKIQIIANSVYGSVTNFGISSTYLAAMSSKCIIGLSHFQDVSPQGPRPSITDWIDTGTAALSSISGVSIANHANIGHNYFCMITCDINHFVSASNCVLCNSGMVGCLNCTTSSICTVCDINHYLLGAACPLCANNISNCLNCTSGINCTLCKTYYYVNTGFTCTLNCTIINCTTCVVVGAFLHCSVCQSGYYTNTTHCNSMCGDSIWVPEEVCEDGNAFNNDGCSSACIFQVGFYCVPNPTTSINITYCLSCSANCVSCMSSSFCLQCDGTSFALLKPSIAASYCYVTCPSEYYQDVTARTCQACMVDCFDCSDGVSCNKCLVGYLVGGICTTVVGCTSVAYDPVSKSTVCTGCDSEFVAVMGQCECPVGFNMVTKHCTNISGCIATERIGNDTICITCDLTRLLMLSGQQCQCIEGFIKNQEQKCVEFCGDGRIFFQKCDDDNQVSGDGCSSECEVEKRYVCRNGSNSHVSECVYMAKNFALKFVSANKVMEANRGTFKFSIFPVIYNLQKLNLLSSIQFKCQQKANIANLTYKLGTITLQVDYYSDLQGNLAQLTLQFDTSIIIQDPLTVIFPMVSQGTKLIVIKNYYIIKIIDYFFMALGCLVFLLFIGSSLTHRMIGVETLHTYHIILLVHFSSDNFTEYYYNIRFLSVSAGNFMIAVNYASNWLSSTDAFPFDEKNMNVSADVTLGLIGAWLLLYSIFKMVRFGVSSQKSKKMSSVIDRLVAWTYNVGVFPSIIGFLLVNMLLMTSTIDGKLLSFFGVNDQYSCAFHLALITLSSLLFFSQWKRVLVKQKGLPSGLSRCKPNYISIYLSYAITINVFLSMAEKRIFSYYRESILTIILIFLLWFILNTPYSWRLHNAAQIINLIVTALFTSWTILRDKFTILTVEETEIFLMLVFIVLLLVVVALMMVRIVKEIRYKMEVTSKLEMEQSKPEEQKKSEEKYINERQKMGDLLVEANPYNMLVIKQKETMAEMDECNRNRLISNVDLLYFQKEVKQKLGTVKRRLKASTQIDKQLQELKAQLKQEFIARKLFTERKTRVNS